MDDDRTKLAKEDFVRLIVGITKLKESQAIAVCEHYIKTKMVRVDVGQAKVLPKERLYIGPQYLEDIAQKLSDARTPRARTVNVRIPVAVDPQGRWYAYGHPSIKNHDELLETVDYDTIGPSEALYWVTAELTVPEPAEAAASEVETVST